MMAVSTSMNALQIRIIALMKLIARTREADSLAVVNLDLMEMDINAQVQSFFSKIQMSLGLS